jgi:hypothetical protein
MSDRASKTPQQKKALSYRKDCRNIYGNSDKAARNAIPARKAVEHRTSRRKANQSLDRAECVDEAALDLIESSIRHDVHRVGGWTKGADQPLEEYIAYKAMRLAEQGKPLKRRKLVSES